MQNLKPNPPPILGKINVFNSGMSVNVVNKDYSLYD